MAAKITVHEIVTNKILEMMEKGTVPWHKPWKAGAQFQPCNIESRTPYRGINFFLLSMLPFATPVYLTFNQIKKMGGRIKAGQEKKHFPVCFWKMLDKEDENGVKGKFPMLRYFLVWNIEQVDGIELPKRFQDNGEETQIEFSPIATAESIVAGMPNRPEISEGGTQACYCLALDRVSIPNRATFTGEGEFYSTLFHELTHSTGHPSRVGRKELQEPSYFGSHAYSKEELVAELGAAFMCAEAGINNTLENSAAYIKGWMSKLKSDPKLFVEAASKAQKAADYILERTRTVEQAEAA